MRTIGWARAGRTQGRVRILIVAVLASFLTGAASASAATQSIGLHLECDGGVELDIIVPSGGSYASLVEGAHSVGVLKGVDKDADGAPEFLVPGFTQDELTRCDAFSGSEDDPSFEFVAYVLFTPRDGGT